VGTEAELSDRHCAQTELAAPATRQAARDTSDPAQREADGVRVEHEKRHVSAERVTELGNRHLLWTWNVLRQRTERFEEIIPPIIRRLQNDAATHLADNDLGIALGEPTLAWQPDSLTPAIAKQLCARRLHFRKYIHQ
jgi:hypothetical protein